jgi:hypothetical protein
MLHSRWKSARRRSAPFLASATALALVVGVAGPVGAAPGASDRQSEGERLSDGLARAVAEAGFDGLVDFDRIVDGSAQPAAFLPNVDVALIELSRSGRVVGAANVLYDRDAPEGFQVEVDRESLSADGVEFSRWRQGRWDSAAAWEAGPAAGDVTVPAEDADKRYMAAYPASVLKLMVAYSTLRLVDQGRLGLDESIAFHTVDGRGCAYGPGDGGPQDGAEDTVAGWLDAMTTYSDNFSTCVLLQAIHDAGAIESSNEHFAEIGLPSLRMRPSMPEVGNGWSSGTMSMGALDTAKLLLLVAGGPGKLWEAPDGRPVTARSGLSEDSRSAFLADLAEQSFNEVLNPVNLCGSGDAVQGIPSTVPQRWVQDDGHVVTEGIDFGFDTRPCHEAAEVEFAHKTGLTYNAGSDAGIVRALPGEDGRRYIVAVLSNVGNRFGDADWADSDPNACEGSPYVCYPRAFGRLGAAVDDLVVSRPASVN